jgi:hypothetical protein
MNNLDKYMHDSDIINDPMPLREVHAIRLMLHEKTAGMTPEEQTSYMHNQAQKMVDEFGLQVQRPAQHDGRKIV